MMRFRDAIPTALFGHEPKSLCVEWLGERLTAKPTLHGLTFLLPETMPPLSIDF